MAPTGEGPSEWLHGIHAVRAALKARRRRLWRLRVGRRATSPEIEELVEAARAQGLAIEEVAAGALGEGLETGTNPQGVALQAGPVPEFQLNELLATLQGASRHTLVALDGVEDPRNVGAILRVADAAGVAGILLTRRHAPPLTPAVARSSAGAVERVPVARVPNLVRALKQLKQSNFWIFGAVPRGGEGLYALSDRTLDGDRVLVLGAEGPGMRPAVEGEVDHRVQIPLRGEVMSLNVSTAAAVCLFEFLRRDHLAKS
ncbi:23S rRNA (guanosine(2251)-2'-O)-methyltransferase RlmB [Myxococcota bacterium]|nr:23S rRNA (guanosine(2251)-2'-O)-methyltransferase RlmB [Myxococcota bacterium]